MSEDISKNLALIHLRQGKYLEAAHLYLSVIKSVQAANNSSNNEKLASLYELLALAYLKNKYFEDSINALNKSLEYEPDSLHTLFNLSFVRNEYAVDILNKNQKTVQTIQAAINELEIARGTFSDLAKQNPKPNARVSHSTMKYSRTNSSELENHCAVRETIN